MARLYATPVSVVIWLFLQLVEINGQAGSLGFYLNGVAYPNGSTVLRTDIGENDTALQCTTDSTTCCSNTGQEIRGGEFFFPDNGGMVPIRSQSFIGYYRNRASQLIRLNRWPNGTTTGQFRCDIPSVNGITKTLFINIVDVSVSIVSYGDNTVGGTYSLECSAIVNGSSDSLNFTWLSPTNNEVLSEMINTTDNVTSTLTLTSLSLSDAGTYACRVTLGSVEKMGVVTVTVEAGISLSLRGTPLQNNSYVNVNSIGSGDNSSSDAEGLLCLTNKDDCCALAQVGDTTLGHWFFPNGSTVGSRRSNSDANSTDYFFRNRFKSVVRLLRVGQPTERGSFRCEVPNANNINQTLYVNIVDVVPTTAPAITTTSADIPTTMPSISINVSITLSGGNAAGEVVVLTCSANIVGSADQPTITWLDSSSQAVVANSAAGARISVSATSMDSSGSYAKSLLFSPLVASDAGLFKCEVVLGGVTNNENVTVTVNDTALRIRDSGVTPLTGQSYNLMCDVPASISFNYIYQWRKNGAVLNESGAILSFSQLRLSDAGQYTCEIVGNVTIVSRALNISLRIPTLVVSVVGQSVTPYNGTVFTVTGALQLDKSIVNLDTTATWVWSFRGTMLKYQETVSPLHESVFTFQPLATDSSGEYTISVTLAPTDNSALIVENSISATYNLFVLPLPPRPPSISIGSRRPSSDDFCGAIMTLNCTADPVEGLFTPPIIQWIDPSGREVPTGGSHNPRVDDQTRDLVFSDVTADNGGLYTCRVVINITDALIVNHFDDFSTTVNSSFPGQVKNLSCIASLSTDRLFFSWNQPEFQGNEMIDYRVEVKQLQHRNGTREVIELDIEDFTTVNKTSTTVGLRPEVPYSIAVRARNLAGCGGQQQIYCFTQEGAPPPPVNVTVSRVNSTAVRVSWARLTLVELRSLATYVITYDRISSKKQVFENSVSVLWTSNSITITNLQSGAQYHISVQTSTSAGTSVPVEVVTTDDEQGGTVDTLINTNTIIAIVCGVVAVVFILAVSAIIIAALKFTLKMRRQRMFNLRNITTDSPFMMTNEFYESCGDRLIKVETTDHNSYDAEGKYNISYVDPKAPQPYEEIKPRLLPPPLPLQSHAQFQPKLQSTGPLAYAQCPLYASATTSSDANQSCQPNHRQTAETSFSRDVRGHDYTGQLANEEEERYIVNDLQTSEAESAYATVR